MADPAAPPRPRRLWRVLLVVSLALNLAIAGLVVGALVRNDGKPPTRSGAALSLGPIGSALSGSDRRAILREVHRDGGLQSLRPGREVDAVIAAVTAQPFDPAALDAALAEGKARRDAVVAAATRALILRVTDMTDQERADFAQRISENRKKRRKRDSD